MTKYLLNVYVPAQYSTQQQQQQQLASVVETRKEVIATISHEIRKIDGLQTVYKAVLRRQNEQAHEIQLKTRAQRVRDIDMGEIREIKRHLE